MQKVDLLFEELFADAQKNVKRKQLAAAKKDTQTAAVAKTSSRSHVAEGRAAKLQLTKDLARLREEMNGPEPAQLTQVAKVMVLCGLPYRQTQERTIVRTSRQADGSLITVTFQAMLHNVALPYGSDRNLFHWATDRSIKSGTPFVPWETATEFLADMQQSDGGKNYARLKESYRRIAGLSITVERQTANRDQALIMPIMERSNLPRLFETNTLAFPEKNEEEHLPTGILFSNPFFQELSKNHVPFPWPILRTLARKPQMLDYMMFLHWRTFAARSESIIRWEELRQQMWQEDTHTWRIRNRFADAIKALKIVFPELPAEARSGGLFIGPAIEGRTLIRGARRLNGRSSN
jgi:Plasmid encoded RepA protein